MSAVAWVFEAVEAEKLSWRMSANGLLTFQYWTDDENSRPLTKTERRAVNALLESNELWRMPAVGNSRHGMVYERRPR